MNDKVKELVEWVAKTICEDGGDNWDLAPDEIKETYYQPAKQILSHPDLALIDREKALPSFRCPNCGARHYDRLKAAGFEPIIPLADAIKELK